MLYPSASFGSNAGVLGLSGLELKMMSAMMAAGRMRRALAEGSLHGPRGTVPSAAAAQRHQQTSPQRVAGSKIPFILSSAVYNQSRAILQQDLHLRKARRFNSESKASYLRIFSFLRMCGTSSITPAGSLNAPPRRLVWRYRSVLLLALSFVKVHKLRISEDEEWERRSLPE